MINVRDQIGILTEEYIQYLKNEKYDSVITLFSNHCEILANGSKYTKDKLKEIFLQCKNQLEDTILWDLKIREVSDTSGFVYANLEETCKRSFAFTIFWSKTGYRWYITHMHISWKGNN